MPRGHREIPVAHHYPLKVLITLVVIAACTFGCYHRIATIYGPPFFTSVEDAHTVVIRSLPYLPMPAGLQSGDKLDLQAMNAESRYAIMPRHYYANSFGESAGTTYNLSIHRGSNRVVVTGLMVPIPASHVVRGLYRWISAVTYVLLSTIVLLVLWRGRGTAATAFMLWSLGTLCATALEIVPARAFWGTFFILLSDACSLLGAIGLFWLVETTVGDRLSLRARWLWRGLFIAVLAAGTPTSQFIGPVLFVTLGWAALVMRPFQMMWAITFLVPVLMLFANYHSVGDDQRLKLKWMLWSGALWAFAVLVNYAQTAGLAISLVVGEALYLLAMFGFLYAVLRHRAVDVSVFIDRTLVYALVTALVVGILAATNSLVQHEALGTGASLLVQIVVPLALGIVLGQVRNYADRFVERVFFRSRYLTGKALRRFARHCGQFEAADELLQGVVEEVRRHLKAPAVAIYERGEAVYRRTLSGGEIPYPETVRPDDPAFVAARTDQKDIELTQLRSALGSDGYAFPMAGPCGLQGVLVCANRPGERFAADERKLLVYLARQAGIALYALRMQEALQKMHARSKLVEALASGALDPASAREQALKLEAGWAQA